LNAETSTDHVIELQLLEKIQLEKTNKYFSNPNAYSICKSFWNKTKRKLESTYKLHNQALHTNKNWWQVYFDENMLVGRQSENHYYKLYKTVNIYPEKLQNIKMINCAGISLKNLLGIVAEVEKKT